MNKKEVANFRRRYINANKFQATQIVNCFKEQPLKRKLSTEVLLAIHRKLASVNWLIMTNKISNPIPMPFDFHARTAIQEYGMLTPETRRLAKMLNFRRLYGSSRPPDFQNLEIRIQAAVKKAKSNVEKRRKK
jgi:hypothetical protein